MLIEFSVGNFLSFKEIASLNMVASTRKNDNDTNTFSDGKINYLKSCVIYGANASGKSNLIEAMSFMRRFVLNSSKDTQIRESIPVERFKLSTETDNMPSHFEIIFNLKGVIYRYGFELDHLKIHKEWLFYIPKTREVKLFIRDDNDIKLGKAFKEGVDLENKTRINALFLSVVAQFNGEISEKIITWFTNFNMISGVKNSSTEYTIKMLSDPGYKQQILNFMKISDLGIEDVSVETNVIKINLPEEIPEPVRNYLLDQTNGVVNKTTLTHHKKFNADNEFVNFELFKLDYDESEGTKKIFSIAGPILETLQGGTVLVIDELDAKLHPKLTRFIIGLFNSDKINALNAQLIFATHDTSLLDKKLFRRDQIWFTEKDQFGSTTLYSLLEYVVRKDASYNKDYFNGKYGAIPFIGDTSILFEEKDESSEEGELPKS